MTPLHPPEDYQRAHLAEAVKNRLARLNPFHAAEARTMSEAALQKLIYDLCSRLRIIVHHEEISDWSDAGWPDLTLIGCSGVLVVELKREDGRVSPDQQDILTALTLAGEQVRVWRPSDWVSGTIERELRAIAHQPSPAWIHLYEAVRERLAKKKLAAQAKRKATIAAAPRQTRGRASR